MSEQVIQGKIEARSREGGGIMINQTWYNTHAKGVTFPENAQPGAAVKLAFTKNGRYNNVTEGKFKVLKEATAEEQAAARNANKGKGGGGGRGRSPEERAEIASQNALTNAVTLMSGADLGSAPLAEVVNDTIQVQRAFFNAVKATAAGKPVPVFNGGSSASSGGGDWDDSAPANEGQATGQESASGDWDDDIPF